MFSQWLNPARVNRRIGRAPQARGFQPLRRHQPLRRQFHQRRTGMNRQVPPLHTQVGLRIRPAALGGRGFAFFLVTQGQMPKQAGHQSTMNHVVRGRRLVFMHALLVKHAAQFLMQGTPLAHPHIGEEVFLAQSALLGLRQMPHLLLKPYPQRQQTQKIRSRILPYRMSLIGGLLTLRRTVTRVLQRQTTDNHQHLGQTTVFFTRQQHAPQTRIDRQTPKLHAERGEPLRRIGSLQLKQQVIRRLDLPPVGFVQKRKIIHMPKA